MSTSARYPSNRGNASPYPNRKVSGAVAKAQLLEKLSNCRPHMLATYTAEELARWHNVPVKECEYHLTIARQRRADEIAQAGK